MNLRRSVRVLDSLKILNADFNKAGSLPARSKPANWLSVTRTSGEAEKGLRERNVDSNNWK